MYAIFCVILFLCFVVVRRWLETRNLWGGRKKERITRRLAGCITDTTLLLPSFPDTEAMHIYPWVKIKRGEEKKTVGCNKEENWWGWTCASILSSHSWASPHSFPTACAVCWGPQAAVSHAKELSFFNPHCNLLTSSQCHGIEVRMANCGLCQCVPTYAHW